MKLILNTLADTAAVSVLLALFPLGCSTAAMTNATAGQLETSLITMITELASALIYNFMGLAAPLGF